MGRWGGGGAGVARGRWLGFGGGWLVRKGEVEGWREIEIAVWSCQDGGVAGMR